MSSRPWYKWFPSDFAADTRLMTLEEKGAYREVLDHLWVCGPFEPTTENLRRIWSVDSRVVRRIYAVVSPYLTDSYGLVDHPKILAQREEVAEISSKRAGAANARWNASAYAKGGLRARVPDPDPEQRLKDPPPAGAGFPHPKKNGSASPAKGTRLPDDWTLPPSWATWANGHARHLDIGLEADKFRDHWLSAAGARGVKRDWQATWRNWIRKAIEFNGNGGVPRETHQDNSPIARMERRAGLRDD